MKQFLTVIICSLSFCISSLAQTSVRIAGGKVSTLAGNNIIDPCSQNIAGRSQEGYLDGKALSALLNTPRGLAYDSKGNLFFADTGNHSIRKLSPDGIVTTFAK